MSKTLILSLLGFTTLAVALLFFLNVNSSQLTTQVNPGGVEAGEYTTEEKAEISAYCQSIVDECLLDCNNMTNVDMKGHCETACQEQIPLCEESAEPIDNLQYIDDIDENLWDETIGGAGAHTDMSQMSRGDIEYLKDQGSQ